MLRFITTALLLGLLSSTLTGVGAPAERLRVMGVTWPGLGPAYIALEKGFWQELGLEVELQIVDDMQVNNALWAGGHADIRYFTLDTLAATAADFPAVVFLRTDASRGGDKMVAIEAIKEIDDIKGHRVAFAELTPQHFFLLYLLDKAGIPISAVTQVPLGDIALSAVAFQRGDVDVAMTWSPFDALALERPGSHVVITTAELEEDILPAIWMARPELASHQPELLKKFVAGWWQAMAFWEEHPEEALKIMAKGLQMPPEELELVLQEVAFSSLERNCEFFGLGAYAPAEGEQSEFTWLFNLATRLWLENTPLKRGVDAQAVLDNDLLQRIFDCH